MNEYVKNGDDFGVFATHDGIWVQDKKTGSVKFHPVTNMVLHVEQISLDGSRLSVFDQTYEKRSGLWVRIEVDSDK